MIDWTIVLQVLNTIILIIVGLFLRSYLPSYFEKKGENRAIREDTGEITSIDESVRSAIAEIRVGRDEYLREQRIYLLRFYDLSVEFYYEKLAVNFGDIVIEDGQPLVVFQKYFFENISELIKSYQRIVVYFDDKARVRINAEKFLLQTIKARTVMKKHFGKIKSTLIDESRIGVSGDRDKFAKAVKASNQANSEYWDAMKPILDESFEALRQYLTSLNEFLRPGEVPKIPPSMFSRDV